MELRCESHILHALLDEGRIVFKCRSKRCGAVSGTVVLHYFDPLTGEHTDTKKFRDPAPVGDLRKESVPCP